METTLINCTSSQLMVYQSPSHMGEGVGIRGLGWLVVCKHTNCKFTYKLFRGAIFCENLLSFVCMHIILCSMV